MIIHHISILLLRESYFILHTKYTICPPKKHFFIPMYNFYNQMEISPHYRIVVHVLSGLVWPLWDPDQAGRAWVDRQPGRARRSTDAKVIELVMVFIRAGMVTWCWSWWCWWSSSVVTVIQEQLGLEQFSKKWHQIIGKLMYCSNILAVNAISTVPG